MRETVDVENIILINASLEESYMGFNVLIVSQALISFESQTTSNTDYVSKHLLQSKFIFIVMICAGAIRRMKLCSGKNPSIMNLRSMKSRCFRDNRYMLIVKITILRNAIHLVSVIIEIKDLLRSIL
jgi:hypothetical protein